MAGQHARHGCWLWPPSTEESPAVRRRVLDCSHRGPPLGGSLRTAREGKEEVETQAVPWFPGRLRRPLSRPLLGGGPQNAGLPGRAWPAVLFSPLPGRQRSASGHHGSHPPRPAPPGTGVDGWPSPVGERTMPPQPCARRCPRPPGPPRRTVLSTRRSAPGRTERVRRLPPCLAPRTFPPSGRRGLRPQGG